MGRHYWTSPNESMDVGGEPQRSVKSWKETDMPHLPPEEDRAINEITSPRQTELEPGQASRPNHQ